MSQDSDMRATMSDDLLAAMKSPEDMDAYLEVRSGQEVIDGIKALLASPAPAPAPREAELKMEVDRLTKRLDLLAVGFGVPDGGRYIADWETRIRKYKELSEAAETSSETTKGLHS